MAFWLAEHYGEYADSHASWFPINKVLVECGNDKAFDQLLSHFLSLPSQAQETLGYAVVARGDPWIARFQVLAFESGFASQHHKLADSISLEIDDTMAYGWIANGPSELGWRILIARHGNAIIPTLIADLPISFDGLGSSPALSAMRFLTDAPESLVPDIMNRVKGRMSPKVMEDIINVLARVRSVGIPRIVRLVLDQLYQLPTYHIAQAVRLLGRWEKDNSLRLRVKASIGDISLVEWILLLRMPTDKNDTMFRRALSVYSDIAVRTVLDNFQEDHTAVTEILGQIEPMTSYHEGLFNFLIATANISALVLKVFSGSFDRFPENELMRALNTPGIEFHALLRALATSSTPTHRVLHKAIVRRALVETRDLFTYREIAKILRVHPTNELAALLKNTISTLEDNEMWLVREIETERRELLVNELGEWLV